MSWEKIDYEVLAAPAASISISVPTPYDFYRITAYIVNDAGSAEVVSVRFNADSGANYSRQRVSANDTFIAGARATGATEIQVIGLGSVEVSKTGAFSAIVAKPAAGVKAQIVGQSGYDATAVASPLLELFGGEWNNTADEVTAVAVVATTNFDTGSSFLLEGLSLS